MLRRWLPRLISRLSLGAIARHAFACARVLNPTALYGLAGLGMIFAGLAWFSLPVALVVTGILVFVDATRSETPSPGDTP